MKDGFVCENVSKLLGDFSIQNISFELPKGYILGVIGRNGCGKTTLLRTLMGLYRVSDGEGDIRIDGCSILEDEKEYKGSIAYVLNEFPFEAGYTPLEISDLYGRYYKGFQKERYREYLKEYQIEEKKVLVQLSTGEKIKLQLAFALSLNAKVYIFDEPTGNLNPAFRDGFYTTVRNLVNDGEKTVIYASYLVEELEGFADYILWMKRKENAGAVKFFGTVEELKDGYRMLEETRLEEAELAKALSGMGEIIGGRKRESHAEILVKTKGGLPKGLQKNARFADLKEIMYYEEKGGMV